LRTETRFESHLLHERDLQHHRTRIQQHEVGTARFERVADDHYRDRAEKLDDIHS
jgi:hypothetical protein